MTKNIPKPFGLPSRPLYRSDRITNSGLIIRRIRPNNNKSEIIKKYFFKNPIPPLSNKQIKNTGTETYIKIKEMVF